LNHGGTSKLAGEGKGDVVQSEETKGSELCRKTGETGGEKRGRKNLSNTSRGGIAVFALKVCASKMMRGEREENP